MPGIAAAIAALAAAFGQHPVPAATAPIPVVRPAALVRATAVTPAERRRIHACSAQRSQPSAAERKILPVACEQPPRSLPNGATGGLSAILGG